MNQELVCSFSIKQALSNFDLIYQREKKTQIQGGGYEEMITSCLRWVQEMMTSGDKVGGWVKKGQNHDDVECE